jgi:hypothetical protein
MLHYSSQRRVLLEHSVWTDALALLAVLAAAAGGAYLVGASPPLTWEGALQVVARVRGLLGMGGL